MACRKLVITDRLPEETNINQLFVENEDIVYYDSADEAIDKIKYYLENESEREKIANSGYAKVMKDHTAKARVDALLKVYEELS
jgi:spore maturation protein CgeB